MRLINSITIVIIFISSSSVPTYSQDEWQDYVSWAWGGKYSPYIEADAGYGSLNHKKIIGSFSDVGTIRF